MDEIIELPESRAYLLEQAVLLYRCRTSGGRIATRHSIKMGEIQPGDPIDAHEVRTLFDSPAPAEPERGGRSGLAWHPDKLAVLAESSSFVVWWLPPGRRKVFVGTATKSAWLPGLVFVGHRHELRLRVFAVEGKAKPSQSSPLYFLDMSNVYGDGGVCIGSMSPSSLTPEGWSASFFDSKFGSNHGLKPHAYCPSKTLKKAGALRATIDRILSRSRE